MAHESRLSAIKVALKRCYLYYPCVPIHMLLRMKYSHGSGPFHWGHLPEWWRCLDRGNVLRKYAVNTKAHSSMYLFARPVSVSVPQQNKDTFCQSKPMGSLERLRNFSKWSKETLCIKQHYACILPFLSLV